MFIRSIELVGYKRMSLVGTGYIKVNFSQRTQIIIGTNGSGKSSLLKELIPFPSDPSDFEKGGSKELVLTHQHQEYILRSSFHPNKYTFIKNNEVLYEGHVASVVKELCEQEFGLTAEIRDIITGTTKFHAITPIKRRELFTQMSSMDYSFGLDVYKTAKEKQRDLSGAIKIAKKNLSVELASILTEEELRHLRKEVEHYHEALSVLLEERTPISIRQEQILDEVLRLNTAIEEKSKALLKFKQQRPLNISFNNKEDLIKEIETIKYNTVGNEALLNKTIEDFNEKKSLLDKLSASRTDVKNNVLSQIETHRALLNKLPNTTYSFTFKSYSEAYKRFLQLYETILDVFQQLPPNPQRIFNRQSLIEATEKETLLKVKIKEVEEEVKQKFYQLTKLDDLQTKPPVECPNCQHEFKLGYSEQEHQLAQRLYQNVKKEIEELEQELKQAQAIIKDNRNYLEHYKQYYFLVKQNPDFQAIWSLLETNPNFLENPSSLINIVEMIKQDLDILSQRETIEAEIIKIEESLKTISAFDENKYQETLSFVNQHNEKIEQLTTVINQSKTSLKSLMTYLENGERLEREYENYLKHYSLLDKKVKETIEIMRQEMIHETIRNLQSELSHLESRLRIAEQKKSTIVKLEEQIEQMQKEEEALGFIVKELSPTEGLIAEGLLGFINQFLLRMNTIIKRIWTYPLEIKPCHVDENNPVDLDYRFPIELNNGANIIPDANQGSLGIKEVIDLAFKIIAVRYLNLSHMPLFLDEFGASFDELHRSNASSAIMYFLDELNISQLFMVSHYEESYGSLANSELLVLKGDSLAKGRKEFNKHVVFHQSP